MAYVPLASKAIKAGEGLFKYFTDDAVERAVKDANAYKSRELIVDMPIDTFLSLAKTGKDATKAAGVKNLDKFDSLPYIGFREVKDGVANGVLDVEPYNPGSFQILSAGLDGVWHEDANNNGILDVGEDLNGNGLLDTSKDDLSNFWKGTREKSREAR